MCTQFGVFVVNVYCMLIVSGSSVFSGLCNFMCIECVMHVSKVHCVCSSCVFSGLCT